MSASSRVFADQAPLRGKVPGLGVSLALDALVTTVAGIGLSACAHAQAGPSAGLLALLVVIPAVYVGLVHRRSLIFEWHGQTKRRGVVAKTYWRPSSTGLGLPPSTRNSDVYVALRVRPTLVPEGNSRIAQRLIAGNNAGAWAPSQVVLAIQSWVLRQAYPRAPPIRIAVPSSNLGGSARRLSDWSEAF